jgi:hypothetical protein
MPKPLSEGNSFRQGKHVHSSGRNLCHETQEFALRVKNQPANREAIRSVLMKFRCKFAALLLVMSVVPSSAADFSLMTGGRITGIEDTNNILADMNIAVGQEFMTFYDFDDATPNTNELAHLGVADYRYRNTAYGFAPFQLGNLTVASPATDGHFLIHLLNNHNGLDAYTLLEDEPQISGGNFTDSQLYFNFLDSTQTAFDSLAIPTTAIPAPARFDQRYGHLFLETENGSAIVRFMATTLQPVPAPSSLLCFAGLMPLLGIALRTKRRVSPTAPETPH